MVQKQIILQFAASSQGKSMSRSNDVYGLTPKKHWFFLPNEVLENWHGYRIVWSVIPGV